LTGDCKKRIVEVKNIKRARSFSVFVLCGILLFLTSCGFKPTEVSVADCSITFTGAHWEKGGVNRLYNDTMMYFVLSGTLTNNGDVAVRPTDHLIGELSFDGYNTLYTLKPKMPSEVEEVAPGETAEVTL
jgi:hypothetical protein